MKFWSWLGLGISDFGLGLGLVNDKISLQNVMLNIMEDDQSLGEVNATIGTSDTSHQFHVPVKERQAPSPPSQEENSVVELYGGPVTISTHELPAPYGCR